MTGIPIWDLVYTAKPIAMIFDVTGNYDYYEMKLIQKVFFIVPRFGVVAHVSRKIPPKRFKGKKATFFFDMGRTGGEGRPFDPQKPITEADRIREQELREKYPEGKQVMQKIKDGTILDPPEYKRFTKEETKALEKTLSKLETPELVKQYLDDKNIEIIEQILMDGYNYKDDGGIDDEATFFNFLSQMYQTEKDAKRLVTQPVKPKFKIMMILVMVVAVVIVLVAMPQIINGFGSIHLPSMKGMFGGFLMGAKAMLSSFIR